MAHGQPEPGTFSGRFRREERVENLLLDLGRDTRAIVADADFDSGAEISCYRLQLRFKAIAGCHRALGCGVKPIRDQVQKRTGDLLRVNVRDPGLIEIALQGDIEIPSLSAGTVRGKVQALLDNAIDLDRAVFA